MKEYLTIVTKIIACDDLNERLDTAFYEGDWDNYLTDTDLRELVDDMNNDKVINYSSKEKFKFKYDSLKKLIGYFPKESYFIAYKSPVLTSKNRVPSWDYTKTTWVYLDNLNLINYYRIEAGKRADESLIEKGEY